MTGPGRLETGQRGGSSSWTPLVERILPILSVRMPEWAVLKNHTRLPVVTGDIDLCVPRSRWDAFIDAYLSTLASAGSFAVVACDHYVGTRITLAVPLDGSIDHALEIDLVDEVNWKGTNLLSATDLLARCVWDERGFRRVPTGIEAAYQLTCRALRHGGGLASEIVEAKAIREKALADIVTFQRAMLALHGSPGGLAARRFVSDEWRSWVGLVLAGRRMLRAARHPLRRSGAFIRRKVRRHQRGVHRRVEGSPRAWLREVSRGHRCHLVGPDEAFLSVPDAR